MGQQSALAGLFIHITHFLTGQEVQAINIALFLTDHIIALGAGKLHHGLKHQLAAAFLNILTYGVQIGGKHAGHREQTLAVLALTLCKQLLEPLVEQCHCRLIRHKALQTLALVVEAISGGGIFQHIICVYRLAAQRILCGLGPGHQSININTGHSDGQQTHGGEHAVTATHIIRHDKGLIALCICQRL